MDYQIRHVDLGVYHGHLAGKDFWENLGPVPEAGAMIFPDEERAQEEVASMIEAYTQKDPVKYAPDTFTVEPFDREYDEEGIRKALRDRGIPKLTCWLFLISKYHPEVKENYKFN